MRISVSSVLVPSELATALTQIEIDTLKTLAKDKVVLECGAEFGASTIALAQRAKKVYSVDWQRGDASTGGREKSYESTASGSSVSMWEFFSHGWIQNLFRFHVMYTAVPILGAFEDVLPMFGNGVFEMCFLDGDHQYESVQRDTELILPHLAPGAIFAFHDYGRDYSEKRPDVKYGVTKVVNSLGKPVQTADHLAWITV